MNNQHAGLSQVLAEQRITERREQAAHARLAGGARWPRRRRRRWVVRGWWQLTRWPAAATDQPVQRPHSASDRSEGTMSNRTRSLILGATLAAMNLAGMTAIAQAQPPDGIEQFRRGERASQEQTTSDATVRRLLARERFSIPSPTPAQVPAPVQPDQPNGQPTWLVVSLGGLAAVLAVVAGLALLAVRRANRRARVGHAT
jgi:hypothetical protein